MDFKLLFSLMCMSTMCFAVLMKSPQSIILLLMFQAFLASLMLSFVSNIWFTYILFLVFLGGMLVVFTYISSLASSIAEKSWFNKMNKLMIFIMMVILSVIFLDCNSFLFNIFSCFSLESSMIYSLMSSWSFILYLFIVMYLFLTLFNICNMLKVFKGPLLKFL
uniref:NADH dehydrogenase subunit 6 n=1 Tax=Mongoloniscus sinensis TaxID=1783568 RepID=A0A3G3LKN5_9CRUS|nr:NADH dehydrogenase subunit 6 [Mongoloniscus sinensis]AYQ93277.1 NADH dehydrogenase subunit 6 [Mongoloniscus sinensis]